MGNSSKRARRRQKAQESLEREASHSKQVKEQKLDSDIEEEEDHEVLFPPKTRESVRTPPSPNRVLGVPDCGIVSVTSMVKTLNYAIAAVSQDTEQIQRAYQQLRRDNLARDKEGYGGPHCHGERIWLNVRYLTKHVLTNVY